MLPNGIPASFPFIYKCRTTYLEEHKESVQPMGQDGEGEGEQGSLVIWHILQPEPRGNLFLRALNKHWNQTMTVLHSWPFLELRCQQDLRVYILSWARFNQTEHGQLKESWQRRNAAKLSAETKWETTTAFSTLFQMQQVSHLRLPKFQERSALTL